MRRSLLPLLPSPLAIAEAGLAWADSMSMADFAVGWRWGATRQQNRFISTIDEEAVCAMLGQRWRRATRAAGRPSCSLSPELERDCTSWAYPKLHQELSQGHWHIPLRGGIPDRMPFVPLVNEYFWETLPKEWCVDNPTDCCRRIGADVAERWVPSFTGFGIDDNVTVADETDVQRDAHVGRREMRQGERRRVEYVTPVGTISEVFRETAEAGKTLFREEQLIKTAADICPYQYLWEAMSPQPDYRRTQERIDYIGTEGMAWLYVPCTPILHLIMYDLGLERLAYLLADHPHPMHRLLDTMAEKALAACEIAASSPAKVGIIAENSGTLLVSPTQFATYCAPIMKEYVRLFKARGRYLLLHACGHLRGLLPQIATTGIHGIESLTPPPTGNVDLAYARQVLGSDRTIIGGFDPIWFLNARPDQIERRVEELAVEVYPGDHFMLMPADSTPAFSPLANFAAVRRAIERVGRWSAKGSGGATGDKVSQA